MRTSRADTETESVSGHPQKLCLFARHSVQPPSLRLRRPRREADPRGFIARDEVVPVNTTRPAEMARSMQEIARNRDDAVARFPYVIMTSFRLSLPRPLSPALKWVLASTAHRCQCFSSHHFRESRRLTPGLGDKEVRDGETAIPQHARHARYLLNRSEQTRPWRRSWARPGCRVRPRGGTWSRCRCRLAADRLLLGTTK